MQFLEHLNFGLFQFNIISSLHETQSELIKYVQIFQNGLMLYNIFTLHWRRSHWNILLLCETSSIWWIFNAVKGNHVHLICICSAVSLVTMYLNWHSLHIKSSDFYKRSNVPMYSIRFTIKLMFIRLWRKSLSSKEGCENNLTTHYLLILHTTASDKKAAGKNKITVSLTFGTEHCLLNSKPEMSVFL